MRSPEAAEVDWWRIEGVGGQQIGATCCRWRSHRGNYRSTGAGGAHRPHQISAPVSQDRSSSLTTMRSERKGAREVIGYHTTTVKWSGVKPKI